VSLPLFGGHNSARADYVKQVTAYKEGSQQMAIYFVLADAQGAPTAADGWALLMITEEHTDYSTDKKTSTLLYQQTFDIKASDFTSSKVGQGAFEHDLLLFPIGRLPYTDFKAQPAEFSGKVSIDFHTADGRTLHGDDTVDLRQIGRAREGGIDGTTTERTQRAGLHI
jgi:hypothetical protein